MMNNMLMRNTKLVVTALAMMFLVACGGVSDGGLSEAEKHYNQGVDFHEFGDYETAIASYDLAIALDPEFADAYYNRGLAYYDLEQVGPLYDSDILNLWRALEDYTKAIELDPNYQTKAYYNKGLAYYDLEQYDRAVEDYTKAIALDPEFAGAYNNRGLAYKYLEQYDRAVEDYTKAVELDPKHAAAYNNRGITYKYLEQYDRALEDYTKAIELDPNYQVAIENRKSLLFEHPELRK